MKGWGEGGGGLQTEQGLPWKRKESAAMRRHEQTYAHGPILGNLWYASSFFAEGGERMHMRSNSLYFDLSNNPLTPQEDTGVPFHRNFNSILRRDHQKNFLWAFRLWVGRRKEPILGYVPKNNEKKNLVHKGITISCWSIQYLKKVYFLNTITRLI